MTCIQGGNRTFRDNLTAAAFDELYAYDGAGQLTSFSRGTLNAGRTGLTGAASRSQNWDYDAAGNWDGVTTNGTAQARAANRQNEITAVSGATAPTFDANGNLTRDEAGRQYTYDAWDRMVAARDAGNVLLSTYAYDGDGRRVSGTAGGATTSFFYADDWAVLEERVGAATRLRNVWSPVYVDALVVRHRDANADGALDERLWAQQDANWKVTALADGSGAVVERYAYDPFGQLAPPRRGAPFDDDGRPYTATAANRSEPWTTDAFGHLPSGTTAGNPHARTHSRQNGVVTVDGHHLHR